MKILLDLIPNINNKANYKIWWKSCQNGLKDFLIQKVVGKANSKILLKISKWF